MSFPAQLGNPFKAILQAASVVIGKVRLVTAAGDEITDDSLDAVRAFLLATTAVIGKVRLVTATGDEVTDDSLDAVQVKERELIVETPFTGTGNLTVGTHRITPGVPFELEEIELHLSGAPTTGTQTLVITKDDGVATAYDKVLLSIDLVANAILDLSIMPGTKYKSNDKVTVAWTNTDGVTFGLIFKHKLL